MYLVIKQIDPYDFSNIKKFNSKDDAWNHVFDLIKEFCFCNIVFSDRVKNYVVDKINKSGIVSIWEMMRNIAHCAYPYEHHKVIMIDTDKIE